MDISVLFFHGGSLWGKLRHDLHFGLLNHHAEHGFVPRQLVETVGNMRIWMCYDGLIQVNTIQELLINCEYSLFWPGYDWVINLLWMVLTLRDTVQLDIYQRQRSSLKISVTSGTRIHVYTVYTCWPPQGAKTWGNHWARNFSCEAQPWGQEEDVPWRLRPRDS